MRGWLILLGMLAATPLLALEPGAWVGVVGSGPPVFSTDAKAWADAELPESKPATLSLRDVAWGLNRFIAVGGTDTGATIVSSPTGRTWRQLSLAALAHPSPAHLIAFGSGRFVVATARELLVSTDGEKFTSGASLPGTASLLPRAIACGDTEAGFCFVLIGDGEGGGDTAHWRASTTDGTTIDHFDTAPRPAQAIAYGAGHFVTVGSGFIESSHDGQIWTLHPAPGDALDCVVWTGRRFLAGSPDALWTSTDALSWTRAPSPAFPHLLWARDDPTPIAFALSPSRKLLISENLQTWSPTKSPSTSPTSVAFAPAPDAAR